MRGLPLIIKQAVHALSFIVYISLFIKFFHSRVMSKIHDIVFGFFMCGFVNVCKFSYGFGQKKTYQKILNALNN